VQQVPWRGFDREVFVKKVIGLSVLIMTATPAIAADPIAGTWKLDVGSSKFAIPPPKEQIEVYTELASGEIEMVLTRAPSDGKSTSTKLTWPATGGVVQDPTGTQPKGETLVETSLGPGEWYVTYLRNGKQYLTMHKVISQDGQSMRQTIKGLDPQGRPAEQIQVLRRQ
jgi:hypothetical protein